MWTSNLLKTFPSIHKSFQTILITVKPESCFTYLDSISSISYSFLCSDSLFLKQALNSSLLQKPSHHSFLNFNGFHAFSQHFCLSQVWVEVTCNKETRIKLKMSALSITKRGSARRSLLYRHSPHDAESHLRRRLSIENLDLFFLCNAR